MIWRRLSGLMTLCVMTLTLSHASVSDLGLLPCRSASTRLKTPIFLVKNQVTDLHVASTKPLPAPAALLSEIPCSPEQAAFVADARQQIHRNIFLDDPRFVLVVGPCSIHDTKAGLEYATRLAALSEKVKDRILIVMRVYFEKPRTTVGWKGLIMDPHLDGSYDIEAGLRAARNFLRDVIDLGLPTATELLDPITPQYIADLICWSAIGARTSESQTHRQMASGLSMPMGFKNTTFGALQPAINAIRAAMQPQTFLGVNRDGLSSAVTTKGNPNCHIILRGGNQGPNYSPADVAEAKALLLKHELPAAIMIDASHANCKKDHTLQPDVFRDILKQFTDGEKAIIGAMAESNLEAGSQSFPQPKEDLVYGQSITDKCMDWDTTEALILEAYEQIGN